MSKLLKKTLILLIITAIFMAPISAGIKIDKKNNLAINIEKKEAEAQMTTTGCGETVPCVYIEKVQINRNSAKFNVKIVNIKGKFPPTGSASITIKLTGNTTESQEITRETMDFLIEDQNMEETKTKTLCIGQSGCDDNNSTQLAANTGYTLITGVFSTESKLTFQTAVEGSGQGGSSGDLRTYNALDLGCNSLTSFSMSACVAQMVSGIQSIVNLLATLAAHILDFFVYYSTNSSSYTNGFIQEGWGAVRDIANIFFIIALLYVAIKTVLGLNVTDNKKLISMVILIALIINFSLFTTKIVIDGSNILAKVFYNNITGKDANGKILVEGNGQKSISLGIVQKFQPQNLISQSFYDENTWTSIFIMLIAIIVMFYTAFIFISVSLLFVARVASLWISMIFSPIAFASYTVPFDIPGFGHKEWWKSLFENAMLAPLFIFFLLIIIKFAGFLGNNFVNTDSGSIDTMFASLMKVIIPFLIIVILLKKAKDLAVKYSGELGQAIVKGAAVVGGLALGGAGLGMAALGRGVVGRVVASASRNEDAMHYGKAKVSFDDKMAKWKKEGGVKPTWETHKTEYAAGKDGKNFKENLWTKLGGKVNANQIVAKDVDHARHEIDEAKKKAGLEGVNDKNLSGVEKSKIQDAFIKDKKSEIEGDIRKGYDSKGRPVLRKDKTEIESENQFKARTRNDEAQKIKDAKIPGDLDPKAHDGLSPQGREKLKDNLRQAYNVMLKDLTKEVGEIRFAKLQKESEVKVSGLKRMSSMSTSGSYDVRSLPGLKTDKREGLGTKATVGLIAAVATGMRAGLKSTLNVHSGTPQGALGKDLAETITSALKGAKINVKIGGDSDKSHGDGGHGGSVGDHSGH